MTEIFYIDSSLSNRGKFIIRVNHDRFKLYKLNHGSFNIIMARVLGVSYANYLRICRDSFGAELIGKNSIYPVAYFNTEKDAQPLVLELNKRANKILKLAGE